MPMSDRVSWFVSSMHFIAFIDFIALNVIVF